jgi:hypothetical protein
MPALKRLLYVGTQVEGGTCRQRMIALRELGHQVATIDTQPHAVEQSEHSFSYRIRRKLIGPADLANANEQIIRYVDQQEIDVLWIDKGLTITSQTLQHTRRTLPRCIIAGYSPDDMAARHNQSRQFLGHLPFYDVFFTTKSYGVEELAALGCPRVEFIGNAYDPNTHRPMAVTDETRRRLGGPVGFIGDYEIQRAESMLFLAVNGISIRIWGPNWHKCKLAHANLRIERQCLWSDDYASAICAFDINLGFLRKINRDLQTQRSIEIPACQGFMLAERTTEHADLFQEGQEAAFFASYEELLEKTKHYLNHATERRQIAENGLRRCRTSGYSNHDRLATMMRKVCGLAR